jgi:predicted DNA-binding transcriptional regulator AlpA
VGHSETIVTQTLSRSGIAGTYTRLNFPGKNRTELAKAIKPEKPPTDSMPRLLTSRDVSQITGLSVETLAQWRSQGKGMPFLKISRNVVRYRETDLDAWLNARIVRPEQDDLGRGRI